MSVILTLALWELRDEYSDQETDIWLEISQNQQLLLLPSNSVCGISWSSIKIEVEYYSPKILNISEVPCLILPHLNIYSDIFPITGYSVTNSIQVLIIYSKFEHT